MTTPRDHRAIQLRAIEREERKRDSVERLPPKLRAFRRPLKRIRWDRPLPHEL
jgi:hypothetical protein